MATYNIKDELNILDPKGLRVYKDEFNALRLEFQGDEDKGKCLVVEVVMGFPLTNSEQYISFFEIKDGKRDKEIGMIEDLKKLDSTSRKVLKTELKRVYFMPQITKINRLKETHGVIEFDVETDKGKRKFETRHREDIRRLKGGRIIIKDSDGNRYEILDYQELDSRSATLIDSEV